MTVYWWIYDNHHPWILLSLLFSFFSWFTKKNQWTWINTSAFGLVASSINTEGNQSDKMESKLLIKKVIEFGFTRCKTFASYFHICFCILIITFIILFLLKNIYHCWINVFFTWTLPAFKNSFHTARIRKIVGLSHFVDALTSDA